MRRLPLWLPAFLELMRRTGGNVSVSADRAGVAASSVYRICDRRPDVRLLLIAVEHEIAQEKVRKVIRSNFAA